MRYRSRAKLPRCYNHLARIVREHFPELGDRRQLLPAIESPLRCAKHDAASEGFYARRVESKRAPKCLLNGLA